MRDTVEPHRKGPPSPAGSSAGLEIAIWTVIASVAALTVMGTLVTLTGGTDQVARRASLLHAACVFKGQCDSGDSGDQR